MPRARGEAIVESGRPAKQLDRFIARYSTEVARLARQVLAVMRRRLPGATELVYDNYNALAIGFGASDRSSEAVFSIALYPRWVSLFFLDGARLSDPDRLLKGSGSTVRHIMLMSASRLDEPGVQSLMSQALERAGVTMSGGTSASSSNRSRRASARGVPPRSRLTSHLALQEIDDALERIEPENGGHRGPEVRVRVDVVKDPPAARRFQIFDPADVETRGVDDPFCRGDGRRRDLGERQELDWWSRRRLV